MKQVRICSGAALALVLSLSAIRADEPDTYNSVQDLEKARKQRVLAGQNIWWERLIPGRIEEKQKAQQDRAAALSSNKEKKIAAEKDTARSKPVEVTGRQAELNKLLRREAVCQKLREIADDTNDPDLAKQADLLESRAWAIYDQKLTVGGVARFQPMKESDAEARLLKNDRKTSDTTAQADAQGIRTIRGDVKE